jgi:hypothetical protein
MPVINTITALPSWSLRDLLRTSLLNTEFSSTIDVYANNDVVINSYMDLLLQGAGTEQAKLLLALPAAPTGWTRDSSFDTDSILKTSNVGASAGGSWTISGFATTSDGGHTHSMSGHTHSISHTHSTSEHSHSMSHNHDMYSSHTHVTSSESPSVSGPNGSTYYTGSTSSGYDNSCADSGHSHSGTHTHTSPPAVDTLGSGHAYTSTYGGDTDVESPSTTAYAGNSGGPSAENMDSTLNHSHTIIHTGMWRPKYTNMIACKKD